MIRMQPDQFNLMPHTDMEFPDSETIRVWKTGSLEPDINTYAGVVGSSFHNGTIEAVPGQALFLSRIRGT